MRWNRISYFGPDLEITLLPVVPDGSKLELRFQSHLKYVGFRRCSASLICSGTTEHNTEILLQLTGSRLCLSINHLLIGITYRSFLLAPVEFFAHDLHNTWQRFICRLHVQEAEAGPASDNIDGGAGVLFYGVQNLRKSTREEESSTGRICLVWCTSASMYGNSDTSLLPTIGHLCPVT